MVEYYFTFRSITAATRAERLLREAGIRAAVVRTPLSLLKHGCGYSVRVQEEAYIAANAILRQSGYQKIYRKNGEKWQEVSA